MNETLQVAANKGKTIWLQNLLRELLPKLNQSSTNYQSWFNSLIKYMSDRELVEPTQQKDYFSDLVTLRDDKGNLYTHLFRAVSATIAAYWYCPSTVPEMEFRAAIQGHYQILDEKNPDFRRSIAAGKNYFSYKISDGAGNIDGRLGIKLGLPDVEIIEQFRQAYISSKSDSLPL